MKPLSKWMAGQDVFRAGQVGICWRLDDGLIRLDMPAPDGAVFAQLARPGDWLGAEMAPDGRYAYGARTLVSCVLSQGEQPDPATLWQQHHRRTLEAMQMRTGTVPQRVKQLLLLISESGGGAHPRELPTLRDMADIVGSAPETVCRVLSGLRRSDVLQHRQRQAAYFDHTDVLEFVLPRGMTRSAAFR